MSHPSTPRRPGRRTALVAAALSLVAVAAPLMGANPAAAVNAPLTTTDGIGIRIDENALLGPALEAIETEMQAYVDTMIQDGAEANSVMDDPDWVWTDSNLELGFDFVDAGTTGFPQGGLKVDAQIQDIRMQFYRYGEWWQPECLIEVNPDTAHINASAKVDTTKLPNAPLTVNPITATWDEDPDHTIVEGNFLCNGYLINEWWDGLWGDGSDIADGIEAELNAVAQDLVDDLWADHVAPVVDSLAGFGISFNQIRADDHGLIVTADVDATGGIVVPGYETYGPVDVTTAQDSGATSDVNTLLANRGEVTVTAHPNVVNQYLHAIRTILAGAFGQPTIDGPAIEAVLLNPADRASYSDTGWSAKLTASASPYTTPAVSDGAPIVGFPTIKIQVYHSSNIRTPVATFDGSMGGVGLTVDERTGTQDWGPALDPAGLTLSVTRTQANAHAAAVPAQASSALVPLAQHLTTKFSEGVFTRLMTFSPIDIGGGVTVAPCTSCGRFPGDQRFTETFTVS